MSTRFTCLIGVLVLFAIGLLVACGSHYSASSDGLVIVPSLGSAVLQSFSFNLSNGHVSQVNTNPAIPGPPDTGSKSAIILDPTGAFAYVTTSNTPNPTTDPCTTKNAIATYKVNSDGTITAIGSQALAGSNPPVALAMDSAGKVLFVANSSICLSGNPTTIVAGSISVFTIGSDASLSPVGTFSLPVVAGGPSADPVALAVTPTAFPSQHAVCSGLPVPTAEYLYVADAGNNQVWKFVVDMSSGSLMSPAQGFPTDSVPSGVAVDACNRFVYVTNQGSNKVSGYTICNGTSTSSPTCLGSDGSLVPATGSPYNAGNGPGPLAVDPFGNFVYVVDTVSFQVSEYRISQVTGGLSPLGGAAIATGPFPVAIAIRSDDQWLFVTNSGSTSGNGSVSQFAITPATGTLSPAGTGITTDTFPSGVAVK